MPSLGVARVGSDRSFVVADIPGLIEGAADGAGLGIRFLKHLERCRVLIHLVDILPIDKSDPAQNISVIESELYQYSEKLAEKPQWLVFNKIDTIGEEEAAQRAADIAAQIGWEGDYYLISAATGQNVSDLTRDIMDFIEANPRLEAEDKPVEEAVTFKWDDYHQQAMQNPITEEDWDDLDDDGWTEEDDEGVEIIYKP